MGKMPELKTVVDSIADGAVDLAEGPVRVAENMAATATSFAEHVKANMDDFKNRMPEDLSAIPDCAMKAVAHTVSDGISFFEGVGKGVHDTLDGVKNQIRRVTG